MTANSDLLVSQALWVPKATPVPTDLPALWARLGKMATMVLPAGLVVGDLQGTLDPKAHRGLRERLGQTALFVAPPAPRALLLSTQIPLLLRHQNRRRCHIQRHQRHHQDLLRLQRRRNLKNQRHRLRVQKSPSRNRSKILVEKGQRRWLNSSSCMLFNAFACCATYQQL
jgi:hypothetical protein